MKKKMIFIIIALLILLVSVTFYIIVINEFPLFSSKIYLVPCILMMIITIALIIIPILYKKLHLLKQTILIVLLLLFISVIKYTFFPYDAISKTNNFNNYKIFDIQVYDEAKEFFPDNIDVNEVIEYSYYYSYTYHSVYEIYLEIKLDNTKYVTFKNAIDLKYNEIDPVINKYNNSFYEYIIEDNIHNNNGIHGDMIKIAYSDTDNIIIYEYMRLKRFVEMDSINFTYFNRFNISQSEYFENIEK